MGLIFFIALFAFARMNLYVYICIFLVADFDRLMPDFFGCFSYLIDRGNLLILSLCCLSFVQISFCCIYWYDDMQWCSVICTYFIRVIPLMVCIIFLLEALNAIVIYLFLCFSTDLVKVWLVHILYSRQHLQGFRYHQ